MGEGNTKNDLRSVRAHRQRRIVLEAQPSVDRSAGRCSEV